MKYQFICFTFALLLLGCNNKQPSLTDGVEGSIEEYESSAVNSIDQAKPEIMVLPSDHNLQEKGVLTQQTIDGETFIVRDYQKYLLEDSRFKGVASYIQQAFIDKNFPLNDFEQELKSLSTQKANDIVDNLSQDAKTKLLAITHPDIILELDYSIKTDFTKSNGVKNGKFLVNAIDPYTNKVVASISDGNLSGTNEVEMLTQGIRAQMGKLMNDIQKYFSDIVTRGREVTVRINVDGDSNQKLNSENIEGDTYADAIVEYIKTHTVKGAYKLQTNTADQLTFNNVRIKLINEDGTQYGVYDWTHDLQKHLKKELGLSSENKSQGLGEIVLTIKGM